MNSRKDNPSTDMSFQGRVRPLPVGKILTIIAFITFCVGLYTRPFNFFLAVFSLIGFAVILFPLVAFTISRELRHLTIFIPASLTWLYFLGPYLYESLPQHSYRIIPTEHLPIMAGSACLALVGMLSGYYFSFRRPPQKTISSPRFRLSLPQLARLTWCLIALGIATRVGQYYAPWILKPFGQLVGILDFAPVLSFCSCLLFILRRGKSLPLLTVSFLYLLVELLLRISETLFSKIAFLLAGLLLVYIIERRRIPWKSMICALIIFYPLYESRENFRLEAHERWHYTSFSQSEKIPTLLNRGYSYMLSSYSNWEWAQFQGSIQDQASSRLEGISFLGQCVHLVENEAVELKYGATFWWLPITPIPRFIAPWKPINYHPTRLAEEYGCKGIGSKAAMNFPMLVEMFINFGFIGMVIGSFFQGLLYKWTLRMACFGLGDLNLLLFINILWHLEKIESNITMIFGGIFQALITWWIIGRLLPITSQEQGPARIIK